MSNILLITRSYPSIDSREKNFLNHEIREIVNSGHTVTIMPLGRCYSSESNIPESITINHDLSRKFSSSTSQISAIISALTKLYFWTEIIRNITIIFSSQKRLKNFIRYTIKSEIVRKHINSLDEKFDIIYTYWCTGEAVGSVQSDTNCIKVSRVHGYDLYSERSENHGYLPYRGKTFRQLDAIFTTSESAKRYILEKNNGISQKLFVHHMGVPKQDVTITDYDGPSEVNIFTCSFHHPVKRLQKIFGVINSLSEDMPDSRIIWSHYGASKSDLFSIGIESKKGNLEIRAMGIVQNNEFIQDYKSSKMPIFMNLSSSEGQPVSIMEAMSCGIPIVANDVGGVSELVDSSGLIFHPDEEPQIIAKCMKKLLENERTYLDYRAKSVERQVKKFHCQSNFSKFAEGLKSLTVGDTCEA